MTVEQLIESLAEYPKDHHVELTRIISADTKDPEKGEMYEISLDFPIVGLAQRENSNEVLLVVNHDKTLAAFAKNVKTLR